jgi:hypothetical protein
MIVPEISRCMPVYEKTVFLPWGWKPSLASGSYLLRDYCH